MSAINEISLPGASGTHFRLLFARELWKWILEHQNDKVRTINFWIFRKTVYVRDLFPAFELLLGPKPADL